MKIGVPNEIKSYEYRVGLIPSAVKELTDLGHELFVEHGCGSIIGFTDEDYETAGATIVSKTGGVYTHADLIVKVKEPQWQEFKQIQSHHTLFCYLHLSPDEILTDALVQSGATCIAYETVTCNRTLPLLTPMSMIAGRLATQMGAQFLGTNASGKGILMGGCGNAPPANVLIIGAGVVGTNAAEVAVGMGANVTVMDIDDDKLEQISWDLGHKITTVLSNEAVITEHIVDADLVIGAVLVPGGNAPIVITRAMVDKMKIKSVIVDVAIDQGGCVETSKPTTHENPISRRHGVIHYCVPNLPSIASRTASEALTAATLPYVKELASKGILEAIKENNGLRNGVNIYNGTITCEKVAEAQGKEFTKL